MSINMGDYYTTDYTYRSMSSQNVWTDKECILRAISERHFSPYPNCHDKTEARICASGYHNLDIAMFPNVLWTQPDMEPMQKLVIYNTPWGGKFITEILMMRNDTLQEQHVLN